jgi:hypothetical protein
MIRKTTMIAIASLLLLLISIPLAAQTTTDVLLSWPPNPEPDILRYIVFRSPDTLTAHFAAIDSVNASTFTYTNSNINKGVYYYYRLKAKNGTGASSPYSNPVSIFAIPQNASSSVKQRCQITAKTKVGEGIYDVTWSNTFPSIGFVQYGGSGGFTQMSTWDNASYATTHTVRISGLTPATYYLRATAYDSQKNMVVSAIDTIVVTPNTPTPLSAPQLSVFPVPYNPGMGNFQIENLPEGGSATIYSESGVEVTHLEPRPNETGVRWDGTNTSGSRVMSGVYYVVIRDAKGNVFDKRPIMVVNK